MYKLQGGSAPRRTLNVNKFRGVDLAGNPTAKDTSRADYMLNMTPDRNGYPRTRHGWEVMGSLDAQINGIYRLVASDSTHVIVHHGGSISEWRSDGDFTLLYDDANNAKSYGISLNDQIIIFDGAQTLIYANWGTNADPDWGVRTLSDEAYVPITIIAAVPGMTPGGVAYEDVNMIGNRQCNRFCVSAAGETILRLCDYPVSDVEVQELNSQGAWVDVPEEDYTLDPVLGILTFTELNITPLTGADNYSVTFSSSHAFTQEVERQYVYDADVTEGTEIMRRYISDSNPAGDWVPLDTPDQVMSFRGFGYDSSSPFDDNYWYKWGVEDVPNRYAWSYGVPTRNWVEINGYGTGDSDTGYFQYSIGTYRTRTIYSAGNGRQAWTIDYIRFYCSTLTIDGTTIQFSGSSYQWNIPSDVSSVDIEFVTTTSIKVTTTARNGRVQAVAYTVARNPSYNGEDLYDKFGRTSAEVYRPDHYLSKACIKAVYKDVAYPLDIAGTDIMMNDYIMDMSRQASGDPVWVPEGVLSVSGVGYYFELTGGGAILHLLVPETAGDFDFNLTYNTTLDLSDRVNKCTFACLYGYEGNADRLFISGNRDMKNYVWWSEINKPNYFPDLNYAVAGDDSIAITAFSWLNDGKLAVHKEASAGQPTIFYMDSIKEQAGFTTIEAGGGTTTTYDTRIAFSIRQGAVGKGVISNRCSAYFDNLPVHLSGVGVIAIASVQNIAVNERFAAVRSYFINPLLLQQDLSAAEAITFDNKYFLKAGSYVFVADGDVVGYNQKGNEYSWEWYVWDNVPVRVWYTDGRHLYFGTSDGRICRFTNGYTDDGEPVKWYWQTPWMDFGQPAFYKKIKNVILLTAAELWQNPSVEYRFPVKTGKTKYLSQTEEYQSPFICGTNYKAKKVSLFQLKISGDKPCGLSALSILFSVVGKFKK